MSEQEKLWYLSKLEELMDKYEEIDDKHDKRKIDILHQIKIIEDILMCKNRDKDK